MASSMNTLSASLLATSLAECGKTINDNVFSKTPALWYLTRSERAKKRNAVRGVNGGYAIQEMVEIARNTNIGWRDPKKNIPANEQDPFRLVQWMWASMTGSIPIFWADERANAQNRANFVQGLLENFEKTTKEKMGRAVYGSGVTNFLASNQTSSTSAGQTANVLTLDQADGTGADPRTFEPADSEIMLSGLEAIVSDGSTARSAVTNIIPDGTDQLAETVVPGQYYGSIILPNGASPAVALDRTNAAYAWWRSAVFGTPESWTVSGGTDGGLAVAYQHCQKYGEEEPDLILTDQATYNYYSRTLLEGKRFQDDEMADAGFRNLMYEGAIMRWDQYAPIATTYVLCTDSIGFRPDSECIDGMKMMPRQSYDDKIADVFNGIWMGQMICTRPQVQVKMINKSVSS